MRRSILLALCGCNALLGLDETRPGAVNAVDGGVDTVATDTPPPDASCSQACQAPDTNAPVSGMASCIAPQDQCPDDRLDNLEPIDLCSCSAGFPTLFAVRKDATKVNLALVADPRPAGYSIDIGGLGCHSTVEGTFCTVTCGNRPIYTHPDVAIGVGGTRTLVVFDGDSCQGTELFRFTVGF